MTLTRLALAHLRAAPLTTLLNIILLALGAASIVVLVLVAQQLSDNLSRNAERVDLVLGAKGSPVQLVLSSVYHADVPTGNIDFSEAQRWATDRRVAAAAPLSLGDSVNGYRIVGTTMAFLDFYTAELAEGQLWRTPMEAVIGAEVSAATGLKVGDTFAGAHGLSGLGQAHEAMPYRITGVLARNGSVIDRLVLTSLQSVWAVHDEHEHDSHADEPHDEHDSHADEPHELASNHADETVQNHENEHNHNDHKPEQSEPTHTAESEHQHHPDNATATAPEDEREITAMLLRYQSPLAAVSLPRQINNESNLQAAAPAFEFARLLKLIGVGLDVLAVFAFILVASAALSIFAALYGALSWRRGDLAMMRCLGGTRRDVMLAMLIEGLLLAIAGVLLGLLVGHGLVEVMGQALQNGRGVRLTGFTLLPAEFVLVAGFMLVGLLAAALPAWQAYRTDVSRTIAQS